MDVMTDLHAESLPCGADVAALVEQVGDGRAGERSAHQATCPYCQTALEELGRLWRRSTGSPAPPCACRPGWRWRCLAGSASASVVAARCCWAVGGA